MWIISLPITIPVSKKNKFSLNLNQYRNTHFQILNKAKVNFHTAVAALIKHLPFIESCGITYTLYVPTKRRVDISNICSVVDKFFCDTLVESGKLADDNFQVVRSVSYQFGGVDSLNPRVEARITLNPSMSETILSKPSSEPAMQITLVQHEIETAIKDFINKRIRVNEGQEIRVDLAATRGAEGFKATIDILDEGEVAATPVPTFPINRTTAQNVVNRSVVEPVFEKPAVAEVPAQIQEQDVPQEEPVKEIADAEPVAESPVTKPLFGRKVTVDA